METLPRTADCGPRAGSYGFAVMLALLATVPVTAAERQPAPGAAAAEKVFPRIPGIGGIYEVQGSRLFATDRTHKLVFDVTDDAPQDSLHPGLEKAARGLNLYSSAGVPPGQVMLAVVVHGEATPLVLSDEAHRQQFGVANPNTEALTSLHALGIRVVVCGQALRSAGFAAHQVSPHVRVTLSAITALGAYQHNGYALIP